MGAAKSTGLIRGVIANSTTTSPFGATSWELFLQVYVLKAPLNTERARATAERTSRVFVQKRIKTSWRAKNAAISNAENCRSYLRATLQEEDFRKVTSICEQTADHVFAKCKERQDKKFEKLREKISRKDEQVNLR